MRGFERWFVLWSLAYTAIYVPIFVFFVFRSMGSPNAVFFYILPFHFLGMIQNIIAFILTIRDLYLRPFPQENQKLTWLLLIVLTGGIGWIAYLFLYALKPRAPTGQIAKSGA